MTTTRKIRKLEGVIKEKEPRWIRIKTYNNGTIVDATCSSCKYTWEYTLLFDYLKFHFFIKYFVFATLF